MMIRYIALCALMLFPSGGHANEAPPVPEGGLSLLYEARCTDQESGERGYCYYQQDVSGVQYLAFFQGEVLMFIRRILEDGYETIWMNDQFNSV